MADPGPAHPVERRVHRVAHGPDPWVWTPWQYAPFGGRWDDPDSQYRVLYLGASRYGCYLEVLAQFRPDPKVLALYEALAPDDADQGYPTVPQGVVPAEWLDGRIVGSAAMIGMFVPVGTADVLAWLRRHVAGLLIAHRIPDLDGAAIRSADRAFTQDLSRWLYAWSGHGGPFDGVEFESRHGNRLEMWAVFERDGDAETSHLLTDTRHGPINRDDRDLQRALAVHGLTIG